MRYVKTVFNKGDKVNVVMVDNSPGKAFNKEQFLATLGDGTVQYKGHVYSLDYNDLIKDYPDYARLFSFGNKQEAKEKPKKKTRGQEELE